MSVECSILKGHRSYGGGKKPLKLPFPADSSGELMTALHYQMSKAVSTPAGNATQLELGETV